MNCVVCEKRLSEDQQKKYARYCSPDCRIQYKREHYRLANPKIPSIPTATVGAISELKVATDLLEKGYHVFRALSPSCPCDIAILRGDKLLKVEVKTGYRSPITGKLYKHSIDQKKFDVLAHVLPDEIIYEPPVEKA